MSRECTCKCTMYMYVSSLTYRCISTPETKYHAMTAFERCEHTDTHEYWTTASVIYTYLLFPNQFPMTATTVGQPEDCTSPKAEIEIDNYTCTCTCTFTSQLVTVGTICDTYSFIIDRNWQITPGLLGQGKYFKFQHVQYVMQKFFSVA